MTRAQTDLFEELSTSSLNRPRNRVEGNPS
jgi:hypothetical protein